MPVAPAPFIKVTLSTSIHHKCSQMGWVIFPEGLPNLQKFSTTILRDFIRGTHPLTRALTSCLWCIFARAPMVMKYRGTLTRCSVSLICIKREQAWFSAEWFNLGIKAGCGNKRFVSLASEQHPFPPLSLSLSVHESYFPSL